MTRARAPAHAGGDPDAAHAEPLPRAGDAGNRPSPVPGPAPLRGGGSGVAARCLARRSVAEPARLDTASAPGARRASCGTAASSLILATPYLAGF